MAALAHDRGVDGKMTNTIKGYRRSLNRVEVPLYIWHYSNTAKEIYRYNKGGFEAHAAYTPQAALQLTYPTKFYPHHHLKVPPIDTVRADVSMEDGFLCLKKIYAPSNLWREITDPKELERIFLQ